MYADCGAQRHDPSHLLTHRLGAPLPALAGALEDGARSSSRASLDSDDCECDSDCECQEPAAAAPGLRSHGADLLQAAQQEQVTLASCLDMRSIHHLLACCAPSLADARPCAASYCIIYLAKTIHNLPCYRNLGIIL